VNRKICLVHYSSAPGGIEVLMPEIIRMLPDTEFSVFVLRPTVSGDVNVYENLNLSITYGSVNNFVAAYRLLRYGIKNREAIFHGFNTGPFFLLIIRLAGVRKAVYSVRGTLHYSNFFQKILRKFVWNIAVSGEYRFIANSGYSRDVFLNYIHANKTGIEVIYNPVSSNRIKFSQAKKNSQLLRIIYVGRLAEGKNLFRWLDIAALIHKTRNNTRFLIYGEGPLRDQLIGYSNEIGATDYVTFKGYVSNIAETYQQADLMMFLSKHESFGNVVVESILCGTPVIAADIPSIREIFRNYPQFLVPSDANMELKILEKINNLEELNTILPAAAEEFKNRFSIEQHINGLKKVYDSFGSKVLEG
jgi:glycosyltransferase involved in cell wall biosynthesis